MSSLPSPVMSARRISETLSALSERKAEANVPSLLPETTAICPIPGNATTMSVFPSDVISPKRTLPGADPARNDMVLFAVNEPSELPI